MSGWWPFLEERTREAVDAEVRRDRRLTAVKAVWEALRPLGVGVHEAEQVVHDRYRALGDRVRRASPDPLDVPSLASRARTLPGRPVAVEAHWDGDTVHDWFVVLTAILDDPPGEAHLATVHRRPGAGPPGTRGRRGGQGPRRPSRSAVPFRLPGHPGRRGAARAAGSVTPGRGGSGAPRGSLPGRAGGMGALP